MSDVRYPMSGVRCQVSGVGCHFFGRIFFINDKFKFNKLVEPVGGGSVINGATPSNLQRGSDS